MTIDHLTGRCLCGETSYTAKGAEAKIGVCHCQDCQRWNGGPFLGVNVEHLKIDGPVCWYESSDWAERGSCSVCGSAMSWRLRKGGGLTITAGSLDDPSVLEGVDHHIFIDHRLDAYDFSDDSVRKTAAETIADALEKMKAEDA